MPRYSLSVSERYDDDDAPANLHRVYGLAIGLSSEQWPRWQGRAMQHAFTLDLEGLELELPAARGARALSVFVDSYYELDVESSAGIRVVWLTQAQIDAYPEATPPSDFVAEPRPNHEAMEDADPSELPTFDLQALDDESESEFGESYLGGAPAWGASGPPEQLPEGTFVLQVMFYDLPICRINVCLFVFEGGAYLQADDPEGSDRPMPWPEAIAASRELVVLDRAPEPGALQKWGGLPRGVGSYDWPKQMSHILTWVPDPKPEEMDGVAFALFGRLSKTSNWDEDELSFYDLHVIRESDLDEDPEVEAPEGVEVLDERAIELRELPEGTTWRDLQTLAFVGPRPAWRCPDRRSTQSHADGSIMQLTDAQLPVTPGPGTLHLLVNRTPIWHAEPGAPQASSERYVPAGTLYANDTCAAIVVGWRLGFSNFSVLPEQIEALEQTLIAALATRDPAAQLRLYVPSDTTTDRNREVHGKLVFGRALVEVEANDYEPGAFDPDALRAGLERLPTLDASFWREALAFTSGVEAPDDPNIYLMSWGPLCYAGVRVGVAASKADAHVYKFVANQDMEQEWSSEGVDGVTITSVEFSDVSELELDRAELAKVDKLTNPGFWLICRYD